MQTKVRDRQAEQALQHALDNVAPESLFGKPQTSVFLRPQRSPFSAPQTELHGSAMTKLSLGKAAHLGRPQRPAKRRSVKNYVIILGDRSKKAKHLWVPMFEYASAWEGYMEEEYLAMHGDQVDFTEAQYGRTWLDGMGPDNFTQEEFDDSSYMGVALDTLIEAHVDCNPYFSPMDSVLRPDLAMKAKEFRAELVDFPQLVIDALEPFSYRSVAAWAGIWDWDVYCGGTEPSDQILMDMSRSTSTGVGAAAVDFALWNCETIPSRIRVELDELIDQVKEDSYVSTAPSENIILDPNDLHPGTRRVREDGSVQLFGEYSAVRVEYMTDPKFECVGYRDVFYKPCGVPVMPTLKGAQEFYQ